MVAQLPNFVAIYDVSRNYAREHRLRDERVVVLPRSTRARVILRPNVPATLSVGAAATLQRAVSPVLVDGVTEPKRLDSLEGRHLPVPIRRLLPRPLGCDV